MAPVLTVDTSTSSKKDMNIEEVYSFLPHLTFDYWCGVGRSMKELECLGSVLLSISMWGTLLVLLLPV